MQTQNFLLLWHIVMVKTLFSMYFVVYKTISFALSHFICLITILCSVSCPFKRTMSFSTKYLKKLPSAHGRRKCSIINLPVYTINGKCVNFFLLPLPCWSMLEWSVLRKKHFFKAHKKGEEKNMLRKDKIITGKKLMKVFVNITILLWETRIPPNGWSYFKHNIVEKSSTNFCGWRNSY